MVTTLRLPSAAKRPASVCDCARQMSNRAEQRRDGAVHPLPARKRALRHPAVDQHHRQPPRGARQDQVRPQIGFDEQRQRRPPVIEEARDVARRIIGHILMDDVGRKALGDDRGRGHRARGQQDAQVQARAAARSAPPPPALRRRWRRGSRPADLRAERRCSGRGARQARRIFLALLQPPADQRRRQRHHRVMTAPVDAQRHRQWISQERPPDARRPHRRGGSLRSGKFPAEDAAFPSSRHRHPAGHA